LLSNGISPFCRELNVFGGLLRFQLI
jgi:hypothetical protein